jgi:hypothetical protein
MKACNQFAQNWVISLGHGDAVHLPDAYVCDAPGNELVGQAALAVIEISDGSDNRFPVFNQTRCRHIIHTSSRERGSDLAGRLQTDVARCTGFLFKECDSSRVSQAIQRLP